MRPGGGGVLSYQPGGTVYQVYIKGASSPPLEGIAMLPHSGVANGIQYEYPAVDALQSHYYRTRKNIYPLRELHSRVWGTPYQ